MSPTAPRPPRRELTHRLICLAAAMLSTGAATAPALADSNQAAQVAECRQIAALFGPVDDIDAQAIPQADGNRVALTYTRASALGPISGRTHCDYRDEPSASATAGTDAGSRSDRTAANLRSAAGQRTGTPPLVEVVVGAQRFVEPAAIAQLVRQARGVPAPRYANTAAWDTLGDRERVAQWIEGGQRLRLAGQMLRVAPGDQVQRFVLVAPEAAAHGHAHGEPAGHPTAVTVEAAQPIAFSYDPIGVEGRLVENDRPNARSALLLIDARPIAPVDAASATASARR